jgi:hypothetical protein
MGRKKKDVVWATVTDAGDRMHKCVYCATTFSATAPRIVEHILGGSSKKACTGVPADVKSKIANEAQAEKLVLEKRKTVDELTRMDKQQRHLQTSIEDAISGSKRTDLDRAVGRFVYHTGQALSVTEHDAFVDMFKAAQQAAFDAGRRARADSGPAEATNPVADKRAWKPAEPPSRYALSGPLLDRQHDETKQGVDNLVRHMEAATLAVDGWTSPAKTPFTNFMLNGVAGSVFLGVEDMSGKTKNADTGFNMMKPWLDLHKSIIVYVCTDTPSVNKNIWQKIEAEYPTITAGACLTHVLNLFFKDVGGIPQVRDLFEQGKQVVQFINNHDKVLHIFKAASNNRILYTPAQTRFASLFRMNATLVELHAACSAVVSHPDFDTWRAAQTAAVKATAAEVKNTVIDAAYWVAALELHRLLEDAYSALRFFDTCRSTMGHVYIKMDKVNEQLKKEVDLRAVAHDCVLTHATVSAIHTHFFDRWGYGHNRMHSAAYMLEPSYWAMGSKPQTIAEVKAQYYELLGRLLEGDHEKIAAVNKDLTEFLEHKGLFASPFIVEAAKTKTGYEWWGMEGAHLTSLAPIARKILSQVPTASSCETNWSEWSVVMSKRRARLAPGRAEKLVYIYHNARLLRNLPYSIFQVHLEPEDISYQSEGIVAEEAGEAGDAGVGHGAGAAAAAVNDGNETD